MVGHPIEVTSDQSGVFLTTDDNGAFTAAMLPGIYTVHPAPLTGWDEAFSPFARTVTLPPDAIHQDFTLIATPWHAFLPVIRH